MKTFDEVLNEIRSSFDNTDLKYKASELVENTMTEKPVLKQVFKVNEQEIHDKVSSMVSTLIEKMISKGNNDYREIVKILEQTIVLVSLLNQYDTAITQPKFKKNVDLTSKIMGMDEKEYNILINKELNVYKQAIEDQGTALNKLLDNKIFLKLGEN